jgi:hypothetical protein
MYTTLQEMKGNGSMDVSGKTDGNVRFPVEKMEGKYFRDPAQRQFKHISENTEGNISAVLPRPWRDMSVAIPRLQEE